MQVEIQIFFKREIYSPIEIRRIVNLDDLLKEISELDLFPDLRLLINVGRNAPDIEKASGFFQSTTSQVILTESGFFALSEYFEIDSQIIQSPYGLCYQTTTRGVVQKIYERHVSNKSINKKGLPEAAGFGFTSDGLIAHGITKTWLRDYILQNPEKSESLALKKIVDDVSYQLYEGVLSQKCREKLGRHRLNFLYGLSENRKIERLIPILPPWVLNAEIARFLELDVRSRNCLNTQAILKFGDLLNFSDDRLLRIPNLGKRSYELIRSRLLEGINFYIEGAVTAYGGCGFIEDSLNYAYINTPDSNAVNHIISEPMKVTMDLVHGPQGFDDEHQNPENAEQSIKTLLDTLNFYISNDIKKPNYQIVFSYRLGVNTHPKTLQEVGDLIGLTRERARQIEKKLLTNFSKKFNIAQQLESKIQKIRTGLSIPLTISGLPIYDSWFSGIESTPWLIDAMFSAFGIASIKVHSFENEFILAPGEYDLIPNSINAVKGFIRDRANAGIRRSAIYEFTTNLVGVFTPELVDTIFYEATKKVIFDLSDSDPKVLSLGSKLVSALTALLNASDRPLRCEDLQSLLQEHYEIKAELNYIRNTCSTSFYQYAPSTFGLLEHSELSDEEIILISGYCFDLILEGGEGKQWHCDKLLDHFIEEFDSFKDKLDKYKLKICLLKSEKFIDLGRMVFIIKTEASAMGAVKRIEFAQFVEAILEKSPVPMHKDAIYKIIERDRGLGDCAQIFHTGRLISINSGTWGLMDKHLSLSDLDFKDIVSELVSILRAKQFGLTEAELLSEISSTSKAYRFKDYPYILFSIGIKSKLCRREDIYLILYEWDDCRRATLRESIMKSLDQVPPSGMKIKQILDIAEGYYQHSIDRPYANRILLDNGFAYDEKLLVWKRVLD